MGDEPSKLGLSLHVGAARCVAGPTRVLAALALLTLSAPSLAQGPTGGVVTGGSGVIQQNETTTRIDQHTQRMAIDWTQFNVAQGHTVQFNQPNAQAAALNRIHDQNPSQIFGAIIANGNVFLVNPNGIVFGETATVNVNSLFATTLDVSPADFMNGNWDFKQVEGANGMVVNRGLIAAARRGSVTLVAGAVVNEGVILADYGTVTLAGATRTYVDFDGDGLLRFEVSGELLNNANGVDSAVANRGTIQANGGQVLLTAAAVDAIFASAVNNGGHIQANRIERVGGIVRLGGGANDTVVNSGSIDVSSPDGEGGRVEVTGARVGLMDGSSIDASGATGGGQVYVGGGFQGKDSELRNAEVTFVAATATINADATDTGDGGEVIVWADDTTRFFGTISARGGDNGGDGGFVEVSGKRHLRYAGTTDTRAPQGATGTLLLDPTDLTIGLAATANVDATGTPTDNFTPAAAASHLSWADLDAALGSANVLVTTVGSPDNSQAGDITVLDPYTYNRDNNLTLEAAGDIIIAVGAAIENEGLGALIFDAQGNVLIQASITLGGGDFTSSGGDFTTTAAGLIETNGGTVDLTGHDGAITIGANVTTGGGGFLVAGADSFDSSTVTISTAGLAGDDGGGTISIFATNTVAVGNLVSSGFGNGAAGSISLDGGAIHLYGNLTASAPGAGNGGAVSITGPVTLFAGVIIDTRSTGGASGTVMVNGAVNEDFPLTIHAGDGAVTFQQPVGNLVPVTSLTVNTTDILTLHANLSTNTGNMTLATAGSVVIAAPLTLSTATGDINVGPLTSAGENLAVARTGAGNSTFASIDLDTGELILTGMQAGVITVAGGLFAGGVTTGTGDYQIVLNGGGQIDSLVTIENLGGLSIGASFAFEAGLITSGGPPMTIGGASPGLVAITATGGEITLGSVTIEDGFTLSIGDGVSNVNISLSTVSGVAGGDSSHLVIDTAGNATLGGAIGTDIGSVTIDALTVTVSGSLTTDNGPVTVTAIRNIVVSADIVSGGGNIALTANAGGLTSGGFIGIDIQAALNAGAGGITLDGWGGDTGSHQHGVALTTAAASITTTTGAISITGRGGATADAHSAGIRVAIGALITTESGAISFTGTGGGAGVATHNNRGVWVSGTIQSTGAALVGAITLTGTGGANTGDASGISAGVMVDVDGAVTAEGAAISVTGTGTHATGTHHYGIRIGGTISSQTGTLTLTGTNADAGPAISVAGTVGSPTGTGAVSLNAATGRISGAGAILAPHLDIAAADAVSLTGANMVDSVTGTVTNPLEGFTFSNAQSFEVLGITTDGGAIVLTATTGAITQGAAPADAITGGALIVSAAAGITLDNPDNAVSSLTATTTGAGNVVFSSTGALTLVLTVADGSATIVSDDTITTGGALSVTGGALTVTAADFDIGHAVNAGGVILVAANDRGFDVGNNPNDAAVAHISNTELDFIDNASALTLRTTGSGVITVSNAGISGATYPLTLDTSAGSGNVVFTTASSEFFNPLTVDAGANDIVVSTTLDAREGVAFTAAAVQSNGGQIRTRGNAIVFTAGTTLELTGGTTVLDTTTGGGVATGAAIGLDTVAGASFNLTLNAGTGGVVTVAGDALAIGTLALTNAASFTFSGEVTATALNTAVEGYSLAFDGGGNITNLVTLANTGAFTIGAGFAFAGGIDASEASSINLAGTVTTTDSVLNFDSPVTVNGNATLQAGTGTITVGDAVIADGFTLTLGNGAATPINTGAIAGTANGAASNVTINTTAAVNIGGTVGTDIGTLTITNSGGITFADSVDVATLSIGNTTGSVVFSGALTVTTASIGANAFAIELNGGGTITNLVNFANSGGLTIGAGGFTFTNGVTATAGATTLGGNVTTTDSLVTFGAVNLTAPVTLSTGSGEITTGAVTATGSQDMTVQNSGNATFASIDLNAGDLILSGVTGGTITVTGATTAGTIVGTGGTYDLVLGGGGTLSAAVDFDHTGGLSIGASFAFESGATVSGPPTVAITGTAVLYTLAGETLDFSATAVTIAAGATLTLGNGAATTLDFGDISGTPSGSNLTVNTTGSATFGAVSGIGTLTITNSGGTTFTGTVDATTVTLTATTGTIAFQGALNATTLNTSAAGYSLALTGGGTITDAITFLNTGTLTIGDDAGDVFTFTGGMTATVQGTIELAGTIQSTGANIQIGGVSSEVVLTADTTVSTGAGGGTITFHSSGASGTVNGAHDLTLSAGSAPVILNGAIGDDAPLASIHVSGTILAVRQNVTTIGDQSYLSTTRVEANPIAFTTAGGTIEFGGSQLLLVGSTPGTTTFMTAGGDVLFNTFGGTAVARSNINAHGLSVDAGGGEVRFFGNVGAGGVPNSHPTQLTIVDASLVRFGGHVYTTEGQDITADVIRTNGIHQAGAGANITFTGDVMLENATTLNAATTGNVTINGDVSGAFGLTLTGNTGNVTVSGDVSGLTTLTVTSAAIATFNGDVATSGAQAITGTTIRTSGAHSTTGSNITLTGSLELLADTSFDTGAGAGNITVTGTVNGGGTSSLGLAAGTGDIDLQAAVTGLTTLTVGSATVARFGDNVTTAGTQSFTAGTIRTNGTHQTTDSAITFTGALEMQEATTLDTGTGAGDITVGDVSGNFAFTADAGLGDVTAGTIDTSGGTNGGAVTLSGDTITVTAIDTNGGTGTGGAVTFNNASALTLPWIDAGGDTSGADLTFNGPVLLVDDTTLTTGAAGGDIIFNATIDGGFSLDLGAGTGDVWFNGAVGGATPVGNLTVTARTITVGSAAAITTDGGQSRSRLVATS